MREMELSGVNAIALATDDAVIGAETHSRPLSSPRGLLSLPSVSKSHSPRTPGPFVMGSGGASALSSGVSPSMIWKRRPTLLRVPFTDSGPSRLMDIQPWTSLLIEVKLAGRYSVVFAMSTSTHRLALNGSCGWRPM